MHKTTTSKILPCRLIGRTSDSGSDYLGSSPSGAVNQGARFASAVVLKSLDENQRGVGRPSPRFRGNSDERSEERHRGRAPLKEERSDDWFEREARSPSGAAEFALYSFGQIRPEACEVNCGAACLQQAGDRIYERLREGPLRRLIARSRYYKSNKSFKKP